MAFPKTRQPLFVLPEHPLVIRGHATSLIVACGRMTAKDGIIMMSERERMLNTSASFLVAVTRIAENATLVTDNPSRVERQVETRTGEKSSAIETARDNGQDLPPAIKNEDRELTLERSSQRSEPGRGSTGPDVSRDRDYDFGM
jgi:hypothetical protein